MNRKEIIQNCNLLIKAYKKGLLGQTVMPEDSNPGIKKMSQESRLAYFTLPMALNYQRDSYKLWEAALKTFNDPETRFLFDVKKSSKSPDSKMRAALIKHKLALQPVRHIDIWKNISKTVNDNWGSFTKLFNSTNRDFLALKQTITSTYKKGFPYLSGPKIFNYWSFVISTYGGIELSNREFIEIAPDTHITRCSVKLGVITKKEAETLTKEKISKRWRDILANSDIDPIDMHPPLWFWSRNGFIFSLKND